MHFILLHIQNSFSGLRSTADLKMHIRTLFNQFEELNKETLGEHNQYDNVIFMECEIPKVVVFLKDETFNNISFPGEVCSLNKCPVENCELEHNNISNLLTYELAKCSTTEVSEEILLYIETKGDSFSNHERIKDDHIKLFGAESKLMEDKADSVSGHDNADAYSSSIGSSQTQIFTSQPMNNLSLSQYSDSNKLRDERKTDQDLNTEANLEDTPFHSKGLNKKTRLRRHRHGSDSLLSMIIREKSKANAGAENLSENADNKLNGSVAASLSRQSTVGFPEYESTSFSAANPPSGLLAFSGSLPFPDGISQRSNSTTSTRSFTFPILAPEWNDSPVRMAEADRQHLKKPRCWGMCFTCCRV